MSALEGFPCVCNHYLCGWEEVKPAAVVTLQYYINIVIQRRHRHFKSGQATTNKRSLVHVEEGGGGLQQAMCGSKSYLWNQNAWVPMQFGRAAPCSWSTGGMITRNTYTQGKGELEWDTWPIRLILKLSLQSENETNDPLKSGPALARPAGPATPPLLLYRTEISHSQNFLFVCLL